MINVPWEEFVKGGGIGRLPDSSLYGVGNSSHLCRAPRSRAVVASLLVPREIHFLGPLGRIWRVDPLIGEDGDATVEVMILVGCRSTHMDTTLGHHIEGWVGAFSVELWFTDGHEGTWGCVIVCWTALWSESASHHIEYVWGVTGVVT